MSRRPELPPNAPRYAGAPGHVESYFLRANDPLRPRALWLKATILAPRDAPAVGETWLIWFDGEAGRTFACKHTHALAPGQFRATPEGAAIALGSYALSIGASGEARGEVRRGDERASFAFRYAPSSSPVAVPLSIYPWRFLREGAFPKSKLLTPSPSIVLAGSVNVPALGGAPGTREEVSLDGWTGMCGHNWGREHAFEYAWGQCLFPAEGAEPETMVEGFSGRVRVGGRTSPRLSAAVVRRGAREYRFDRIFDFWRQEAHVSTTRWTLRLGGPDGELRLRMDATSQPFACLGYESPDHTLAYCFNSKLAEVLLEVRPRGESSFSRTSKHGGALELLRREPEPGVMVI